MIARGIARGIGRCVASSVVKTAGGGGGPTGPITAIVMGQSEMEYLFNTDGFYRAITQPTPGNGNLIVVTQEGNGVAPVRTVVNPTTVAAGQVNPAMAAMSAFLAFAEPSKTFVVGDGAVSGTGRPDLYDDSTDGSDGRRWAEFSSVINNIVSNEGSVQNLIECWYNADAAQIENFRANFWPFYFGANGDGSAFTLGTVSGSRRVDRCLWDASAASNVAGRGVFARSATRWWVITPMPFWNLPEFPAAERENFSGGTAPRLSEPARQTMHELSSNSLAQSVQLVVGPSAHVCRFGGGSTDIHPDVASPDGQILLMWPIALNLLRAAGRTINEPEVVGIEGPTDGTFADLVVSLPNGGNLTTLRTFRSQAAPSPEPPHYQGVVGVEITRGSTRRPVFKTSETSYPADFRGTVTITDSGSGSPRRGRVRITPTNPFTFGNSLSYLRGQATGGLLEPRDLDALLYRNHLIEHIPSLYNASALYPFEGIAVKPYQQEIQVNVPPPPFSARSTRFTTSASKIENASMSFNGSTQGTVSFWVNMDSAWPSSGNVFNIRDGATIVLQFLFASTNRATVVLNGAPSSFTTPSNTFLPNRWHHVMISYRSGAGAWFQVYVDGVALSVGIDLTAATLGVNATLERCYVWTTSGTPNPFTGDLAYLYINLQQALDLTVQANRERFLLAKNPVDLGGNGQTPTGSVPAFFFDGGASMSNLGAAGSLTSTSLTLGAVPALP